MNTHYLRPKLNLTSAALLILLVLSGCVPTHKYVSLNYPEGNEDASKIKLKECSKSLPEKIKNGLAKRETVLKPQYNTFSGVTYVLVSECKGECAEAQKARDKYLIACMDKKGWVYM